MQSNYLKSTNSDIAIHPLNGYTISPMAIAAVNTGIPYQPDNRDKYSLRLNETACLTDAVFYDKRALFQGETPSTLAAYHEEMIPQHFERRLQLFFQQAVSCYKTGLRFEIGPALHQGESPKPIREHNLRRDAAHSSTIPCLIASEPEPNSPRYLFLAHTDAYRRWNSTLNMPHYVNKADILIDGTNHHAKLRVDALALLNKVSKKPAFTPNMAFAAFLKNCISRIETALRNGQETPIQETLQHYLSICKREESRFKQNQDAYVNSLLEISIGKNDPIAPKIRDIRYLSIRNAQINQAELLAKIDNLRNQLLGNRRQPNYFERAFRTLFIQSGAKDAKYLKKLFNLNPTELPPLEKGSKTEYEKTLTGLRTHIADITKLANETVTAIKQLQNQEIQNRRSTLFSLRSARHLTQTQLATKLRNLFPSESWHQSIVSHFETGNRTIKKGIAEQLAVALDVDLQLFCPKFS